MKKLLMGLLMLLVSGAASAAWTVEGESEELTLYVDRSTIRRSGNLVKMWNLFDYKTVNVFSGQSTLSSRFQSEYDCKEERARSLAFTTFSGQMLSGAVNSSIDYTEKWMAVAPGSVGVTLWKIACGKL